MIVLSLLIIVANPAMPFATRINIQIVSAVGMALRAMSLASTPFSPVQAWI